MNHHAVKKPEASFARFSDFLSETMGLYFPKEGWEDFEKKLRPVAKVFGFSNTQSCIEWLMQAPLTKEQITTLALYLTVGETYFFRDPINFQWLATKVFSEIIRQRQGKDQYIRVWSAACCTGEEAYSIAITLNQLIPDLSQWNIKILGTDINLHFLQRAEKGLYKEWSFRSTSEEIKKKYFIKKNEGQYEILPHLKAMVKFSYMNLVEDIYPSILNGTNAMDIILCNNVLIYFSQNQIKKSVFQLTNSLVEGGWLTVSAIEAPFIKDPRLTSLTFLNRTFFKKTNQKMMEKPHFNTKQAEDYPFFKEPLFSEKIEKGISKEECFKVELPSFLNLPVSFLDFDFSTLESQKDLKDEKIVKKEILPKDTMNTPSIDSLQEPLKNVPIEVIELFNKAQYPEVINILEKNLRSDQTHPQNRVPCVPAMILLSRAYANQGHLKEAHQWCLLALSCDKLDPFIYYLYATILQEQKNDNEAIIALKQALYLDHNFIMAHFSLANLISNQGNTHEAKRHFRNALELLRKLPQDEILVNGEGVTVGRLAEIIMNMKTKTGN